MSSYGLIDFEYKSWLYIHLKTVCLHINAVRQTVCTDLCVGACLRFNQGWHQRQAASSDRRESKAIKSLTFFGSTLIYPCFMMGLLLIFRANIPKWLFFFSLSLWLAFRNRVEFFTMNRAAFCFEDGSVWALPVRL